jgi:tetratricopeptide (TPR) repeat protein
MRLLERIAEAGDRVRAEVETLRSLELIYEKTLHPELAYMFKHALTHEVAYESVTAERRKALHRTIGVSIEELYADRLGEHYETLAHHFARAESFDRALFYHAKASVKAEEHFANRAVITHCQAALAIAARLEAFVPAGDRAALEERLGLAQFNVSEYGASAAAFERASTLRETALGLVDVGRASLSHFWAHQYDDANRTREHVLAGARAHGLPAVEALALSLEGFAHGVLEGALDQGEQGHERALALARRDGNEEVEALVLANLGQGLEWQGRYAEAIPVLEHALSLGRKLRLPHLIVMPAWFCGKARCCLGDYDRALRELTAAYEICDRIGDRAWKGRLLNTLGWAYAEVGDSARALEHDEAAVRVAREIDDLEILANAQINLGGTHLALGDSARAVAMLEPIEAALATPDPWMRWRFGLHARNLRARVELARGELALALRHADGELAGARRHRAAKLEVRAGITRGRVLCALERWDDADAGLAEAGAAAARIAYPRAGWEALRARALLERRRGDRARADAHHAAAAALVERVAAALTDPELGRRVRASALGDPSSD